jgi:hypothetical protein
MKQTLPGKLAKLITWSWMSKHICKTLCLCTEKEVEEFFIVQ